MAISKKKLIESIEKHRGNITLVAKSFSVSRTTVYKYINKYSSLIGLLSDEREKMIDNVESELYNQALGGNITAMIFFLKTQGKNRGYVERQEVTGVDGDKVNINVTIKNEDV